MTPESNGIYRAPNLRPEEVTPIRVRDELVNCFVAVQSCLPAPPGPAMSPGALRESIRAWVTQAFQRGGASFDAPTKSAILAAMETCRSDALTKIGDPSVIQEHWDEMMKLVRRLPD